MLDHRSWRTTRRASAVLSVALCLGTGCATDASSAPHDPSPRIERAGGEGQEASADAQLSAPLEVIILDPSDAPMAGVSVNWSTSDGGSLAPAATVSDAAGRAATRWRLGSTVTTQTAVARIGEGASVVFHATARVTPPEWRLHAIALATFDGSGQVVHPDVARVPAKWGIGPRALAITPYPGGNAAFEMPSIFESRTAADVWTRPAHGVNPVARPTSGYLSDPDLLYDPDANALLLYYRQADQGNAVFLKRTSDGVTWSDATEIVRVPNHQLVSPTVVRRSATEWHMWAIDSGPLGCSATATTVVHRTSSDGVHWSAPTTIAMRSGELWPWHIDVQWIASLGEYWALFNAKESGSCTTPALYLARSTDGVTWTTYDEPVLARGALPELSDIVYRSTFEYDAASDGVTLWYSGASYVSGKWIWRAATERRARSELFGTLTNTSATAARVRYPPSKAPPLREAP